MQGLLEYLQTNAAQQRYGSAFLLAYGTTWLACSALSVYFSLKKVALAVLFQSAVALPLTFLIMHFLHIPISADDRLIGQLATYLAMSQSLAIPLLLYVYIKDHSYVPFAMATILGMHFLAYTWLNQTKTYLFLSLATVLGVWIITRMTKERSFGYVCMYTGLLLLGSGFYLLFR